MTGPKRPWGDAEIASLIARTEAGETAAAVARALGRTVPEVQWRRRMLRDQGLLRRGVLRRGGWPSDAPRVRDEPLPPPGYSAHGGPEIGERVETLARTHGYRWDLWR